MMLIPDFSLSYEGKNITQDVKPFLLDLTYTDYLAGQSDEIDLTFEDREQKWINSWFPTQGDKLTLALGYKGQALTPLGSFEITEVEWEYNVMNGSLVSVKALSAGISKASRTVQPKAYENTTLAKLVEMVAQRLKLNVTGTINNVPIKRITQYQERDVEFLTRLASEYHHSFKIEGNTLIFTTMESLKQRQSVQDLDLTQVTSIRLKDNVKDTAKKVEVKGFNSQKKKVIKSEKQVDDSKGQKSKNAQQKSNNKSQDQSKHKPKLSNTLKIVTRGESQEQIDARAKSAQQQQEDEQQAGNISLIGNPKLVAGNTINLTNMGVFTGKYLIKSARHHLSRTQGYSTEIEIRMVKGDK